MAPAVLPSDFEWGFATASYQVEGAVNEDGRGPSIWDTYSHLQPSRTNGTNGDIAWDHYHRYEEDLGLLVKYGAKSIPAFAVMVSHYPPWRTRRSGKRSRPWVTLYHWDLPQALQDRYDGWLNIEESQMDFERFGRVCYERFGVRVKNWITLNEPWNTAINGFVRCTEPPGRSSTHDACVPGNSTTEPWIVGKSLILAHARAARLYNREFKPKQGGRIGVSLCGDYIEPWDSSEPKDHEAAERRMEFVIGWFANPMLLAQDYPMAMRQQLQDRLPAFTEAEFALLREAEVDFYGMNYYTSLFARHRVCPASDTDYLGNLDEYQVNKSGVSIGDPSGVDWLRSAPQGFRKHLVRIYNKYRKPIYITENGCPCPGEDKMSREESVRDAYRQKYLSDRLDAITGAIQDGVRVSGYFVWSLMDNFEWSSGYTIKFGVTHINYDTLERTPKESALKIRAMIEGRMNAKVQGA
ncbi:hypothetical protein CNMCM6936_001867 [Aspergillus lentulus]|nr:hypothetical protein CNMCM6936_001867 [Aspergillus lentulus]